MQRFDTAMLAKFNFDNTFNYWKQLELNRNGAVNTWFVFWYATVFLRQGLALFPSSSLVQNIGMAGTDTNCTITNEYDVGLGNGFYYSFHNSD